MMANRIECASLTAREIRRGLRINIAAGALGMAFLAVATGVPITMLMERLGATGVQIGLIVTGSQLAMLAQIPTAWWAGRLQARKPTFATLALLHRLLWMVPALLPLIFPPGPAVVWTVIVAVTLSAILAQASSPLWYSWMADLVPAHESGRFWGIRQSLVTMAFVVMTGLSGVFLDLFKAGDAVSPLAGFSLVFGLGALLGAADIIVHLWVPEPPLAESTPPQRGWRELIHPLKDRDFAWLTVAIGLWLFSLGLIGSFGMVYLKRVFGLTYLQLSLMAVSASLGSAIASAALGLLVDRLGGRAFGIFLMRICPLTGIAWWLLSPQPVQVQMFGHLWTLPQPLLVFTAVNLVSGALYGGVGICHMKLLGELAPKGRERVMAMAVHWTLVGLIAAGGPWMGGWIMDHGDAWGERWTLPFGATWSFFHWLVLLHAAVCWLAAAPALSRVRRSAGAPAKGREPRIPAFGNPLRALTMVYDMWTVATAQTAAARARAIRRLGENRAEFAVRDLIRELDDPSPEVREAAAWALGRIGGDEAVVALIEELQDPHSDVSVAVARALRIARDPRSVDALISALETSDRETAAESARALGAIGDPRSAEVLRETLKATRDPRLASATSEALARLGRIDAIYDILPRLKTTTNPLLRRTLSMAVGDLLGRPGEYYRFLVTEMETPGLGAESLLSAIRRHIERNTQLTEDSRKELERQLEEIQRDFDAGQIARTAASLLMAARRIAKAHPDITAPRDKAKGSDLAERVAVILWFLDLLNHHWMDLDLGHRVKDDLLLGIYALYVLATRLSESQDS